MATVSISGGGVVISTPVYTGTIPLPIPQIPGVNVGFDTTGGVDVLTLGGPGFGALVAVNPTTPAAQIILGGAETIYAGNGEVALGGLTDSIPGLSTPIGLGVGIDTAGGVDAITLGTAVVAVDPTHPAAQVIVGGVETVYGSSNGTVFVGGITDSIPGLSTLTGASNPFSAGHGADTISMGAGTDTVVEAGHATVASLGSIGNSAFTAVDSISGAHNVFSSVSTDQLSGAIGHDALSALNTSSLFGFGADSTAGAHLTSGLVSSGSSLAQVVTPVHTDLTHADGSAGHSLVSMDGGLTTIEMKGISHIGK